ncbi:MAG: helix-turn-helix transcriptional regulator [Gemmatimonadota bacterium]|nr:helix-turn-helix transcriptional regulator [Gemmatimonadota bacterium]MDE2866605.1 helix-turn-helix transcriptional regulator [Gemmatimonadota bacterium]
MANEAWIKRQTKSPEARRRYEEERLILWTTEAIWTAMDDHGLTRAELAARLGTSRANVTQLLSGTRNMTLRSLAALAHACGLRADVHLKDITDSAFTELADSTAGASKGVRLIADSWIAPVLDEAEYELQFAAPRDDIAHEPDMDYSSPAPLQLVA